MLPLRNKVRMGLLPLIGHVSLNSAAAGEVSPERSGISGPSFQAFVKALQEQALGKASETANALLGEVCTALVIR